MSTVSSATQQPSKADETKPVHQGNVVASVMVERGTLVSRNWDANAAK
jgi:hypothetical protein